MKNTVNGRLNKMNKFWEWMKEKKYAIENCGYCIINNDTGTFIHSTKQMLIGYMIEYILAKAPGEWSYMIIGKSIEDIYNLCTERIEQIALDIQ